jgi:hypothetical protein
VVVDVDGLRLKVSPLAAGNGTTPPTDPDIPVSEMTAKLGTAHRAEPRPT